MDDETPSPFTDTPFGRDPAARLRDPGGAGFGDPASRLSNPSAAGFVDPAEILRSGRVGRGRPDRENGGMSAAMSQVQVLRSHTPLLQKIANGVENLGLK